MKIVLLSLIVLMAGIRSSQAAETAARRNVSFEYRFDDDLKQTPDSELRLEIKDFLICSDRKLK